MASSRMTTALKPRKTRRAGSSVAPSGPRCSSSTSPAVWVRYTGRNAVYASFRSLLGTIAPGGRLVFVEITDTTTFEGRFTDSDTLEVTGYESGPNAIVLNNVMKRQP